MYERLSTALGIVRAVADRPRPLESMTVGMLAAATGTSTSSTSRICAELESVGLISHAEGYGAYRVGARTIALSGSVAAPFAIACDFALTVVYQATGATVALIAGSPSGALVIGAVQSGWTLHVGMNVGEVLTDPDGAALRALRPPPAGAPAVTLFSQHGPAAEVATPILGPRGECLAALVVGYPQHRSEQVTPMAERALLGARRQLERSIARAAAEPRTQRPARIRTADPSAIEATTEVLAAIDGSGSTSLTELVAATGLRPDRIRRLLAACEQAGIATCTADGDAASVAWGVHGWHRGIVESTLRGPAQHLVAGIAARANYTTYLTVRLGMRSSTVAECIVEGALSMGSWLGRPAQLIGSDGGPVLVQHFDDAQIRQVFPSRITMTASGTPRDLAAFLKQVQRARSHPPLVLPDFGEDGLTSVAAPVRDAGGAVVAAACIVGPGFEMAAALPTIKRLVGELAESVSHLLHDPGAAAARPRAAGR